MRNLCENASRSNSRLYHSTARCGCARGCARRCVRRRSVPAASCLGARALESRTDSYAYNARSELISASKSGGSQFIATDPEYAYAYDDIGNRLSSLDLGTNRTYVANNLNQYTSISNFVPSASFAADFSSAFNLDGNQTLIRTSTGD